MGGYGIGPDGRRPRSLGERGGAFGGTEFGRGPPSGGRGRYPDGDKAARTWCVTEANMGERWGGARRKFRGVCK